MFLFQTNHLDYTEDGEDCVTKCDWSDGPKKYSMECQMSYLISFSFPVQPTRRSRTLCAQRT